MNSSLKDYYIKGIIGKGTFSTVKLGIDRITGEKVAIKILNKQKILNQNDVERVEREIKILKNIDHINLIKINKIKEDSENFYMIMEYCEIGELFNYIVKKSLLNENESAYYYFQLINGLEYIHSKNIVHRDLKPENLLINNKKILKIIDFGLSNFIKKDEFLSTPCGSPCYASPEMIGGKKYDGNLIDIWSSGIILYAMLCGYLPFEGQNNEILFQNIVKCEVNYPKYLSIIAVDLLKKILVPNPENRISIREIKKHPFYMKGKEIFKKVHPTIFKEIEYNFKLKSLKKFNFVYNKMITKTEENEKNDFNKKMNIRPMNLDEIYYNNSKNKSDSKFKFYNSFEKKNNFQFKRTKHINEINIENNDYFIKLKKDLNDFEKYFFKNNTRHLTEMPEYNLNIRTSSENPNIEKILFKNDLQKLLNNTNYKENNFQLTDGNNFLYINNTPKKVKSTFHSSDIDHSNIRPNLSKNKNEKKYNEYNNKVEKKLTPIQYNQNIKLFFDYKQNKSKNLTPDKNYIFKKIKSIKENKKIKINKNNNSKIFEKFNSEEEKTNEAKNKNNLDERRNRNYYKFNPLSLTNKNTEIISDYNKNVRVRHVSGLSFNNPITNNYLEEINQLKKDNTTDSRFNKYFQLHNIKNSKNKIKNYNFKSNYMINNIKKHLNKNHFYNTIDNNFNKENDKNSLNYNPSVTINNMNYNLNLYQPKIYLSTLYSENQRGNNKFFYNKNKTMLNKGKIIKKDNSKSKKFFDKIMKENKNITFKNNTLKTKKIDSLVSHNNLTQEKLNIDYSLTTNFLDKNYNNKNLDKLNSFIENKNGKMFYNSKEKHINSNLKSLEENKYLSNNKNMENTKSIDSIKENNLNQNMFKKIRALRKSDIGPDILYKLRQKRNEKNKMKNKYINSEKYNQKIYSPCTTLESDKILTNNITLSNNSTVSNKTTVMTYLNKKKNPKIKKKNLKKINILDSLIKDFLNFSKIIDEGKTFKRHNYNNIKC